jgi:hypothetical protein
MTCCKKTEVRETRHRPKESTTSRDLAQRFPDGSLFVPKRTQHILGLRCASTKPACEKADKEDNTANRQHVVGLSKTRRGKKYLILAMSNVANINPVSPRARACCTIIATIVRSGAPINFNMAICRSFSVA